MAEFSSNPAKLHSEGLVQLLIYIRDNKTLGLKYYDDMKDAHLSDMLRQTSIKTENQLVAFSYYSWQDCPDTGISTWAYNIFYKSGKIDNVTHVTVPVDKSSVESEYSAACTEGMALAHFKMLIHELLNKDSDIVPE